MPPLDPQTQAADNPHLPQVMISICGRDGSGGFHGRPLVVQPWGRQFDNRIKVFECRLFQKDGVVSKLFEKSFTRNF
ncbi:hypothetical protein [Komagataeibacter sp. NFXK3]